MRLFDSLRSANKSVDIVSDALEKSSEEKVRKKVDSFFLRVDSGRGLFLTLLWPFFFLFNLVIVAAIILLPFQMLSLVDVKNDNNALIMGFCLVTAFIINRREPLKSRQGSFSFLFLALMILVIIIDSTF